MEMGGETAQFNTAEAAPWAHHGIEHATCAEQVVATRAATQDPSKMGTPKGSHLRRLT